MLLVSSCLDIFSWNNTVLFSWLSVCALQTLQPSDKDDYDIMRPPSWVFCIRLGQHFRFKSARNLSWLHPICQAIVSITPTSPLHRWNELTTQSCNKKIQLSWFTFWDCNRPKESAQLIMIRESNSTISTKKCWYHPPQEEKRLQMLPSTASE